MTFAEIFILILILALVFYLLNPLRQRLETRLYKVFGGSSKSPKKHSDIPLTPNDYIKKENNLNE